VPEISLVGVRRDLVLHRGGSGRAEGAATDLLAELVEQVAHTCSSTRARPELRGGVTISYFWFEGWREDRAPNAPPDPKRGIPSLPAGNAAVIGRHRT
jgi:hypothetical protein